MLVSIREQQAQNGKEAESVHLQWSASWAPYRLQVMKKYRRAQLCFSANKEFLFGTWK